MKKTLNNIFDEANAGEIENLVKQNAVPEVSADTLSSIKDKVYAKTNLKNERKPNKNVWLRIGAAAACFALIVSAAAMLPALRNMLGDGIIDTHKNKLPSVSVMTGGSSITGKQEIAYGNAPSGNGGEASLMAPGFYLGTVVEAEVVEILPDIYYDPGYYSTPLHVVKLRIIESIRGKGLPEEIYLYYPYYDASALAGYDRFIMSLEQVGIENYMLVNGTQSRVDYFSNMFGVCEVGDLGYGSVVAFKNGIVDESFWEGLINTTGKQGSVHPIWLEQTMEQVKKNITEGNCYVGSVLCDYVTADDVFVSDEGKEIKEYVAPSPTSVFQQEIFVIDDRIVAYYTRVINGFLTDEQIIINREENGSVIRRGEQYTADDLEKIPDIGEALNNMNLSELEPPHIEITGEMTFTYSYATGIYRKAGGEVYGVIRIMWYYRYSGIINAYQPDDMYYLYDSGGNGVIVDRDELREVIGNDSFIRDFSYDYMLAWDK